MEKTLEFLNSELLGNSFYNILAALLILMAGYALRKYISRFFSHFLYRFFKKFSQDALHDEFINLLVKPFQFLILILSLYFALLQLNLPAEWKGDGEDTALMLNRVISILISMAITWLLLRLVDFIMLVLYQRALETEDKSDDQIILFMKDLSKVVIVIFALFFILGAIFKLNITSLVAGLGIGGLAIALAAQETLSNLLGSFIIFADKPFKAGDHISIENISGTVEKVGFRSTLIRTLDKSLLSVPNKNLVNQPLNNITMSPFRRVRFSIVLTYNTRPEQLRKVVEEISEVLMSHPETRDDFNVNFAEFGTSSLDILIVYFVLTNDWNHLIRVKEDINYQIMEIVEKNGCRFAFPTQTIHLHEENMPE